MGDRVSIIFIANGENVETEATKNEILAAVRERALTKSFNRHDRDWEVRNERGELLDPKITVGALGLVDGQRLFLTLPVAAGGVTDDREWIEWDTSGLRGKPVLTARARAILEAVECEVAFCAKHCGVAADCAADKGEDGCFQRACLLSDIRRAYLGTSDAKPPITSCPYCTHCTGRDEQTGWICDVGGCKFGDGKFTAREVTR